jgi:carbamoyltransferase
MLRQGRHIAKETGLKDLCMAGGVALNCVANGKLLRQGPFENIWIQPAAGDAGGALGAALAIHYAQEGAKRQADGHDFMKGAYLGPDFGEERTKKSLDKLGAKYVRLDDDELIDRAAQAVADENVLGFFQGRMEFGPRALGGRSIVGDPRSAKTQSVMNLKIKYRESFRPFAPSVLRERVSEYFEMECDSPYMLLVADVREERRLPMTQEQEKLFGIEKLNVPRSDIPSITHVDYSARVQTVHKDTNPRYHALIEKFAEKTGYGVVVNTSFNVRGEPIVCTPADAYRCFMRTEIDCLVCWPFFMDKKDQPEWNEEGDWREEFALD